MKNQKMNNSPIGVFDSGLGGLTVWSELYRKLPRESLIYYGDGKHCPYGNKTQEEIIGYVDFAIVRLLEKGAKMIVVACNAATAMAIDHLRESYTVPFIGLEPAVKPAAMASNTRVIGILATAATLKGRQYRETANKYLPMVDIIAKVGQGLVELVEENREDTPEALELVASYVRPMIDNGADQIVLGCTHYPFLTGAIRKVIGEKRVALLNPAEAIERRVASLLKEHGLAAYPANIPQYEFCTSADEAYRDRLIAKSKIALANLT